MYKIRAYFATTERQYRNNTLGAPVLNYLFAHTLLQLLPLSKIKQHKQDLK